MPVYKKYLNKFEVFFTKLKLNRSYECLLVKKFHTRKMPDLIESIEIEKPLLVFGMLADVQYADTDDIIQYGRKRYYRDSIKLLRNALIDWKKYENEKNIKLDFILQLGDLIDGFRTNLSNQTEQCLTDILRQFKEEDFDFTKIFHLWGNHELFAYKRDQLSNSILNTSKLLGQKNSINSNYYYYDINDKLRLICLDEYEISTLGVNENEPVHDQAKEIMNKFSILRDNCTDQMEKVYFDRFKIYNGAISDTQLKWLEDQLIYCKKFNKKIILAGHIPLTCEASDGCAVWNADDILNLIWSFDDLVLVYLAGHYHPGGYFKDKKNIHHLTLNGILETPLESNNAYVTAFVYENKIFFKNQISSRSFTVNF